MVGLGHREKPPWGSPGLGTQEGKSECTAVALEPRTLAPMAGLRCIPLCPLGVSTINALAVSFVAAELVWEVQLHLRRSEPGELTSALPLPAPARAGAEPGAEGTRPSEPCSNPWVSALMPPHITPGTGSSSGQCPTANRSQPRTAWSGV